MNISPYVKQSLKLISSSLNFKTSPVSKNLILNCFKHLALLVIIPFFIWLRITDFNLIVNDKHSIGTWCSKVLAFSWFEKDEKVVVLNLQEVSIKQHSKAAMATGSPPLKKLLRAPTILVLLFSSEPPLIALLRAWTPFVLIPLSLAPQVVLFYWDLKLEFRNRWDVQ
jgi:hypothetical protein